MIFQFESLSAWWQMAGHGVYVWVCYFVTVLALFTLMLLPIVHKHRLQKDLQRQVRIEQGQMRRQEES